MKVSLGGVILLPDVSLSGGAERARNFDSTVPRLTAPYGIYQKAGTPLI